MTLWLPTDGFAPSGEQLMTWYRALPPSAAPAKRKTLDETVVSTAALQDDDELFIAADANTDYSLELLAFQSSGVTPGFRIGFTLPAGATWYGGFFDGGTTTANRQFVYISASGTSGITGTGGFSICYVRASISIGSTAGNVRFQWCQSTSNASNTTVAAGSEMILTKRGPW